MTPNDETGRDRALTTLAVLMALLAISNFSKPLTQAMDPDGNAGFVFFGRRLHGVANAIMGPSFGLVLAAYAYGAWARKRWVVPLAGGYAAYVVVNLVLFLVLFAADPPPGSATPLLGLLAYALVAIGVSAGGAVYLYRNRDRLS